MRAMSASAAARRSRILATTWSGALARKPSFSSFAVVWRSSFSAAPRSFVSRLRSASTSMTPERSSSTVAPATGSDAVAWKLPPSG